MGLNNIKRMRKDSGFTIVELLIVIVVIGILATITIVAYNGVQQKAKTNVALTNAVQAGKVAEGFNVDNTEYPVLVSDFSNAALAKTVKLPTSITMLKGGGVVGTSYATADLAATATTTASVLTQANGTNSLAFLYTGPAATPTGGVLFYYDYSGTGGISTKYVYYGAASVSSTFYAPSP